MLNTAVLVSGGGTNLQALLNKLQAGELPSVNLSLVVSNKPQAYALTRAQLAGVETAALEKGKGETPEAYGERLITLLKAHDVALVVLAGFMLILAPNVIAAYPDRILNIHPSLIPSFCGEGYYGLRVHEAALARGVKVTGATVHLVNEIPDGGRILAQQAVAVLPGDTPERLQRRVVIVRECDALTTSKKADDNKAEAIAAYLNRLSPSTCLVFHVKGKADARKKLYGSLKKLAVLVDFAPMGEAEAANWARRTMKTFGKQMDLNTAQKLIFNVGSDAALLRQEMEKLAGYLGERETVADEDIDAICVKTLECTVFQMVDAQVGGRYGEAMRLMQTVLEGGEDRFMVLSMLLRQYRILYHMRCLVEERAPQAQLGSLLGIPPFAVSRTQVQAKRYTKERLKAAYDYLFTLEYRLKSGQAPQEGSAEAALFMLDGILNGQSA